MSKQIWVQQSFAMSVRADWSPCTSSWRPPFHGLESGLLVLHCFKPLMSCFASVLCLCEIFSVAIIYTHMLALSLFYLHVFPLDSFWQYILRVFVFFVSPFTCCYFSSSSLFFFFIFFLSLSLSIPLRLSHSLILSLSIYLSLPLLLYLSSICNVKRGNSAPPRARGALRATPRRGPRPQKCYFGKISWLHGSCNMGIFQFSSVTRYGA